MDIRDPIATERVLRCLRVSLAVVGGAGQEKGRTTRKHELLDEFAQPAPTRPPSLSSPTYNWLDELVAGLCSPQNWRPDLIASERDSAKWLA